MARRTEHSFEATFRDKQCTFFAVNNTHISVHRLLWEVWHPGSSFRSYFDTAMALARRYGVIASTFHTEKHQTIDRFVLVPVEELLPLLERASEGSPYARLALKLHNIPAVIEALRRQWEKIRGNVLSA